MPSDMPEGTMMIGVGTQGVCVLAWDGISESELEDAMEVIQEFMASERPHLFAMNGERTGKRITVQIMHEKAPLKKKSYSRETRRSNGFGKRIAREKGSDSSDEEGHKKAILKQKNRRSADPQGY